MVIDGRTLPPDQHLDTDVCIIGAGPAGIAIARELSGTPFRVCLLESGGLQPDAETQGLYRGRLIGHQYFRLDDCRVRRFGGGTNRWGGWTRAMDPIDFEARPWVPDSGWPIPYQEVDRFSDRARALLSIPSSADAMRDATGRGGRHVLPLPPDRIETGLLQFSPIIDFSAAYKEALFAAANVQTILYANVTAITTTPGGAAVERLTVRTLAGNAFTVGARVVVLAAGAIENARLLLQSQINDHDLVGRYFTEHLHVRCGVLVSNPGVDWSFYDEKARRGREPMAWFILPPQVVRDRQLLAWSASLQQVRDAPVAWLQAAQSPAFASALALAQAVVRGRGSARWGQRIGSSLGGVGDVLRALGARASIAPRTGRLFEVFVRAEQAPNRESRITLNGERDRLGTPRVDLDWRITERDRASVRAGAALLAEACASAGVGRVFVPPYGEDVPAFEAVNGGWHQMGTTRMARDAKTGVVDEHCRVHGVANLFVAGSSVFPSCGFANPTFTILALAIRLADHLRARLAAPAQVPALSRT